MNENRLATELGVSRPPLREAFRILENERLVKNIPRIGTFVTELSCDDFQQICEIRSMVEIFAVRQLKGLKCTILTELEKTMEAHHAIQVPEQFTDDEQKYTLFNNFARFHLQLVESAGNSYLTHWYRSLSPNISRYQYLFFFQPGIIAKDLKDHATLVTLIKTDRFEEAEPFLYEHLDFQRRKMMTTLDEMISPSVGMPATMQSGGKTRGTRP